GEIDRMLRPAIRKRRARQLTRPTPSCPLLLHAPGRLCHAAGQEAAPGPSWAFRSCPSEGVPMITAAESVAHGWTCHQAGDLHSAAHSYRLALQADPANADVWYLYGLACHALGQPGDAEVAYEQVLQLRPDHADACNQAGMLLAGAGRFAEA